MAMFCFNFVTKKTEFAAQIVPDLASGSLFKLVSVCSCYVPITLQAHLYFLAQDDSGYTCTFPAPVVEAGISPRIPGFLFVF